MKLLIFCKCCRWADINDVPEIDLSQDIEDTFVNHTDGVTAMYFTRKRNTGDGINDIVLGCQYMLFAWGGKISSKRKAFAIRKHKFREASEVKICMCPLSTTSSSVLTYAKPSTTFLSPSPTSVMTIQPECPPQCSLALSNCQNNPVCMILWQEYHTACRGVNEWNGVSEAPICSEECKEAAEQLKSDRLGMLYTCCICDNEACKNGRSNFETLCKVSPSKSSECMTMHSACSITTKSKCYNIHCNWS